MKKLVFIALTCALTVAHAGKSVLNIQRWTTKQGLQVHYVYLKELPIVDIRLVFDAGSARDGKKWGLSRLVNRLVDEGTDKLSADDIAEQFAQYGTIYSNDSGKDYALLGIRSLLENADTSTSLLYEIIHNATFPEKSFSREMQIQKAEIKHTQQNPAAMANDEINKHVFANHPYASPEQGTAETLKTIDRGVVKSFYKQYYSNQNAKLIIVGAAPKAQAKALANTLSSALSNADKPKPLPKVAPVSHQNVHLSYPAAQTQIRIAHVGIDRSNPDYYPLQVANYILGGGALVSRLMNEVREKNGLAYSVYSQFVPMQRKGLFMVSLSTRHKQSQEALNITKNVLSHYVKYGPTEKELMAAKKNLTGSFPLRLDSNQDITQNVLAMAFFDLPKDYLDNYVKRISQVTITDVNRVLQKYINLNQLTVVTVGKEFAS